MSHEIPTSRATRLSEQYPNAPLGLLFAIQDLERENAALTAKLHATEHALEEAKRDSARCKAALKPFADAYSLFIRVGGDPLNIASMTREFSEAACAYNIIDSANPAP